MSVILDGWVVRSEVSHSWVGCGVRGQSFLVTVINTGQCRVIGQVS